MPLIAIVVAALAIGFEQLIQWKYGPMGIIAFVALTIGIKAKNTMLSGIGAVIIVMLLAPPVRLIGRHRPDSPADRVPPWRGAGSSVSQHHPQPQLNSQ